MKNDGFQYLEQRDADDNITQEGVVSKKSAFTTKDNRGLYDVIAENLRYLYANYNDTQIQKMLAEIKSAYNEMKQDPNWGNPSGATMAINAAKEAKTSADNAKTSADNAKVSETNAKTSETNAKTSETNASESAKKAETEAEASALSADHALQSEKNAKQYADNSNSFAELAQKWAVSSDSPDNQDDTDSDTGKSKSSKEWALQGKRDSQKWAVSSDSPDNQDDTDSDTGKSKSSKEWALQGKRDSQKWAMSNDSPDNQDDTDSQTGKTQSAKSWALQGKADSQKWAMSSNSPDDKKDTDSPTSYTQSSKSWAGTSKAWAMSKSSPDNNSDNDSSTGLTQSAKSWALLAKKSELQVAGDAKQVAENTKAVETNTQTVLDVHKNVVGIQNDVKADKLAIENYKNQTKQYLDDTNKLVANKANQMVYKGDVDNYADLPVNALIGDVYNVLNDDTANNIRSGDKFVWTGNKWERIGAKISGDSGSSSQIDLSGYAKLKTAVTFTQVTADKFIGSIDKAANDVNGNPITGYISSVSSSENKLTFTKGDGTNTEIALTSGNGITPWKSNTAYNVGDIVYYDGNSIYLCQKAHTSGRLFADDFWPNWTKLDQKCVMKHSPMPNLISDGEVFFWDATGLRRSVTTQSGTPTTNNQFTSSYKPVPASLVDYDYTMGENYPHLFNEIAYCGNKRLYKCSKAEPLSLSNTSHGIESYSITGDLGEQTFYITKYDSNSDKYYSELVLKLPKTGTVTRVSFGRWYHVSGSASTYMSTGIVYTSSGGTNYKPAAIFDLTDNVVAKFTATNCTHVKIRVYAYYGAGDHHSNTDTFKTGSIDIQGLSSHWTQIKDERILEYDPSKTTYVSQDVAVFNRKLYRYGFGTNGSAPISEYNLETKKPFWESLIADIDHWTAGRLYDVGTTVLYNHKLYECIELHTSGIDFTADLINTKEPKWVQVDGTNQANIATAKETIEAMTADFIEGD